MCCQSIKTIYFDQRQTRDHCCQLKEQMAFDSLVRFIFYLMSFYRLAYRVLTMWPRTASAAADRTTKFRFATSLHITGQCYFSHRLIHFFNAFEIIDFFQSYLECGLFSAATYDDFAALSFVSSTADLNSHALARTNILLRSRSTPADCCAEIAIFGMGTGFSEFFRPFSWALKKKTTKRWKMDYSAVVRTLTFDAPKI